MWYVYVLKCVDGYYTGCTSDLKARMKRHQDGHVVATKNRRPVALVSYFGINDQRKAFKFEEYLKSGSGRAFVKRHFS